MDARSSALWSLSLVGALSLSISLMSDRLGTAFTQDAAPDPDATRWHQTLPDLQGIHLHPGLEVLIQRVDADPRLVVTVLDLERTAQIQADCPPRLPELIILCEPETLAPLTEEVQQVLLDALGDPEDEVALWAVELLVSRGASGAATAREALRAEDAHFLLARQQALAVHVLARTEPAPHVILRQALILSAPVAAMAALELARMGVEPARSDLERTAARLSDTAEGLVVAHALTLLDQAPPSP